MPIRATAGHFVPAVGRWRWHLSDVSCPAACAKAVSWSRCGSLWLPNRRRAPVQRSRSVQHARLRPAPGCAGVQACCQVSIRSSVSRCTVPDGVRRRRYLGPNNHQDSSVPPDTPVALSAPMRHPNAPCSAYFGSCWLSWEHQVRPAAAPGTGSAPFVELISVFHMPQKMLPI